uniref:Platelet glycoprotein 4 n=1 Tax=Oreochromis niloticus TaxID=8128 RepID=A0A669CPD1_ORENI
MGCFSIKCGLLAGSVFGAVIAILGGILIPVGDMIIERTVKKEAVIEPGTTAYDNWASSEIAVYRQFWLFDVKNPQQVVQEGAFPEVQEKGPYTYKTRYLPKANVTFNPNNTASFVLPMGAIFEPSMSVGPEEDTVTTLNLAVAGAYSLLPPASHILLDMVINSTNSSLFQHRTVKELLWGYNDPILKDTIGLFSPYNGTSDGPYNIFTGKDDISKVSIIDRWRGETKLSFWNDTYCDMINGTDGSSFAPFVDKDVPLYFFSSDICRSVSASYEATMNLKGIEVYRYSLLPSTLASPVDNPDNKCFCRNYETTKNCTLAGALDISSCSDGQLVDQSSSLCPTSFKASSEYELINSLSCRVLNKVKDYTLLPLAWLNETATLDDKTADMFKRELISRIDMLEIVQQVLLIAGVIIFFVCLIAFFCVRRKSKTNLG